MAAGIVIIFEGVYFVCPKFPFQKHQKSYFLPKSTGSGLPSNLWEACEWKLRSKSRIHCS